MEFIGRVILKNWGSYSLGRGVVFNFGVGITFIEMGRLFRLNWSLLCGFNMFFYFIGFIELMWGLNSNSYNNKLWAKGV